MSDNLDAIFKMLSMGDKKKNEEFIRELLNTPNGQELFKQLNSMSADDIGALLSRAPKHKVESVLSDQDKLKEMINDPKVLEKIKKNFK